MADSKETSHWMDRADRRSGSDRRQFSYTAYIPERRCGKDRRRGTKRGRTDVLIIEDDDIMRAEGFRSRKD